MTLNPLRLATDGFFLGTGENTLNPATLNAITGAVWDVLSSDHLAAGTTGANLAAKASQASVDALNAKADDITALVL